MKKRFPLHFLLVGFLGLFLLGCDKTEEAPAPDLSGLHGKWKVTRRDGVMAQIVHSMPEPGAQPPQNQIIIGYKVFPIRIPVADSTYWHFFEGGALQLNDFYVANYLGTGYLGGGILQDGLNPDSVYTGIDSSRVIPSGKRELEWKFSGNLIHLPPYADQFQIEKLTADSLVLLYPEKKQDIITLPPHPYRSRIRFARWK